MDDARRSSSTVPPSSSESSASSDATDAKNWTVSEPLTGEECDACDAVAREADVSVAMAKELLEMGAVYVDSWPEGRGGKVKWQRAHLLDRPLQPGRDGAHWLI
jgi:hypothetical protein